MSSDHSGPVPAHNSIVSSWFPAALVARLEQRLGRRVDVATEEGLCWLLRRHILREAQSP